MNELIEPTAAAHAAANTSPFDGAVAGAAAWTAGNTQVPEMMSGLAEARLLEALIAISGARRVLEIGTFTAVGTLSMAAALPEGGRITTLEVDPDTAATARRHIAASPHAGRVELIVGNALETIAGLTGPFDLVYIDAWKVDYPAYYEAVLPKLAPRGIIVADNLFRDGGVLNPADQDEGTIGMREFTRIVQSDERVHNVLLTIGDGVMLAWHRPSGA
jgi:caffeoyl-CoA O-methyltransferase